MNESSKTSTARRSTYEERLAKVHEREEEERLADQMARGVLAGSDPSELARALLAQGRFTDYSSARRFVIDAVATFQRQSNEKYEAEAEELRKKALPNLFWGSICAFGGFAIWLALITSSDPSGGNSLWGLIFYGLYRLGTAVLEFRALAALRRRQVRSVPD